MGACPPDCCAQSVDAICAAGWLPEGSYLYTSMTGQILQVFQGGFPVEGRREGPGEIPLGPESIRAGPDAG